MTYQLKGRIQFPQFSGTRVLMMPYIQGDPDSLPEGLEQYRPFVADHHLQQGEIGFLTVDETYVEAGTSQRGYGNEGRTLHTEATQHPDGLGWGDTSGWGGSRKVALSKDVQVLIANSIDNTCAIYDAEEEPTPDGDLSHVLDKYPRESGHLMKAGELVQIGIRTPHECIKQTRSGHRQFVRIVGEGVTGREDHFTINPKLGVI